MVRSTRPSISFSGALPWAVAAALLFPVPARAQDAAPDPDAGDGAATDAAEDGAADGASADEGETGAAAEEPSGPPRAPTREEIADAREAFGLGETLFQEGDYQGAADLFREAYQAVPDPTILFRIGDALQRAEDYRGAGEAYEEYLRRRPDADDRADVEARLDGIRQVPGTLVVTTTPEGASVTIDGQTWDGETPLEVPIAPGEHLVTVNVEGYAPAFQEVEVGYDQRVEVDLTLELAPEEPQDEVTEGPVVPPTTAPAVPEEEAAFQPSAGVWVATGVAAAGLVTGTVFGFLAMEAQASFDDTPSLDDKDDGERWALISDIGLGVAAAAGITAVALYFVEKRAWQQGGDEAAPEDEGADVQVTPVVGREGGGVVARMRF